MVKIKKKKYITASPLTPHLSPCSCYKTNTPSMQCCHYTDSSNS